MIQTSALLIKLAVILTFIRIHHTSQVHLNPYEGNYRPYDCTCNKPPPDSKKSPIEFESEV